MRANYKIVKWDLSTIQASVPIVQPGTAMPDISVLRLPAGAVAGDTPSVFLQLGADSDLIPLFTNAQPFHDTSAANQGLYITVVTAIPGAFLWLLIGFSS